MQAKIPFSLVSMMVSSTVTLTLVIVSVLMFGYTGNVWAQDDESMATERLVQECAECHLDVTLAWQDSSHALTFASSAFQDAWQTNQDSTCLSCHTTGYIARAGTFEHEGVTCAACHGTTPANHPDEPMSVSVSADMCADCHITTYHEWQSSPHGDFELACTTCHNPHPQQVRFGDSTSLCLNCHQDTMSEGYAHITHIELACTDCHWHHGELDIERHITTGELMATGHDGVVETVACTTCHAGLAVAMVSDDALTEAPESREREVSLASTRLRVQELEVEVANAVALGENTSAVRLIQGLVVGLAFGGVLAIAFMRLRPGRNIARLEDEE